MKDTIQTKLKVSNDKTGKWELEELTPEQFIKKYGF